MPASIILSHLSWATPDHRPLFSDLSLRFGPEKTGLVGRNGVGKTSLLKLIEGGVKPLSGHIHRDGTLGILRQTVQAEPGASVADLFGMSEAIAILRRVESGDALPHDLAMADWTVETRIIHALARIGLDTTPETRLATLSGGQRTRAGLAALVFASPDFLLLDEPTNNLDRDGRRAVIDLLARWQGGAIVVSHDRELLETMDCIVELTSLGATRYGGSWSHYRQQKASEQLAAHNDLAVAEKRVSMAARNAQVAAEKKARKDSAGKKKGAKGDMPRILLGGLKNRSENTSGDNSRLAESRQGEALEALAEARERIEILQPLTVTLPSTHLPAGRIVLEIDKATFGHVAGSPIIRDLSLTMTGPQRIAVTGSNGSGKSTLLGLITGQLQPWTGTARILVDHAMLDQQVSLLDHSASIADNFRRLNPGLDENACRAALARFRFRADAALQIVSGLSGGELLRAGLACVLGKDPAPSLLILDEPTNHLDIDSLETVEAGLRAYDGALLVVSHDERFLDSIGVTQRLEIGARR